ncbi:MAG: hypothetical protein ACFHWZ_09195 [Phycisphaerales bacterium]
MNLSARDIADSASSIPEANRREVFVSKACGGDDELIAEVKMMLGDAATVADSTRGLTDPDVTIGPDRRGGAVSARIGPALPRRPAMSSTITNFSSRWARAGSGPCGWPSRASR